MLGTFMHAYFGSSGMNVPTGTSQLSSPANLREAYDSHQHMRYKPRSIMITFCIYPEDSSYGEEPELPA